MRTASKNNLRMGKFNPFLIRLRLVNSIVFKDKRTASHLPCQF